MSMRVLGVCVSSKHSRKPRALSALHSWGRFDLSILDVAPASAPADHSSLLTTKNCNTTTVRY